MLKLRSTSNQRCFEHHRRSYKLVLLLQKSGAFVGTGLDISKKPLPLYIMAKTGVHSSQFWSISIFQGILLPASKYHTNLDLETKISATGRWLTIPYRMLNIIFLVVVNHDKTANRRIQLSPAVRIFAPGQKLVLARYSNLFKFTQVFRRWWPWPKTRKKGT